MNSIALRREPNGEALPITKAGTPIEEPFRPFNIPRNLRSLVTPPPFRQPVLDGVRAIAISWVILVHLVLYHMDYFQKQTFAIFGNPFLHIVARGDMGVDLFFVISGYLIGSLLFRE